MPAEGIQSGFQEVRIRDTGYLDGVLKRHEDAFARTRLGSHGEHVLPVIGNHAVRDLERIAARKDLR